MAVLPSTLTELPLLRTKISIPQIPSGTTPRPRLTEWMHRNVQGPVTLLIAPAGFGKTHLLIEWTRETALPVAWLTLDGDDNDLDRLFRYLVGALQNLEPSLQEESLDIAKSSKGAGLEAGLTLLINRLSVLSREMVLVLDDFQVLESPGALQGIGFLLKYLPPNLHLVIASRSEPKLDIALLRAKGRVVELGADELRFTGEEVGRYFQQAIGLQLSPETIQALEERTDGWITSLQMAALSLKHQADPAVLLASLHGTGHHLAGFLAEEVLDQQPEEMRQFLLRSSILEALTGPLCEAVVNPNAQPGYGLVMLNRLEHAHLFTTALDEKHEWFRYHPLFADFLRQVELAVNPGEIPALHQRAAMWLEQNGHFSQAFRHALASGDVAWAADMIERNVQTMINIGEMSALAHWIGRLPDEITHRRSLLNLGYAWALIVTNRLDLASYGLDEVRRFVGRLDERLAKVPTRAEPRTVEGYEKADVSFIRGGLALCESYLAMVRGDMEQAAEFSKRATKYLPADNVYPRSLLALDDCIFSILSGDTRKAIESARAAGRLAHQANNQFAMIIALCALADMQALQGQLSKAWETCQRVQHLGMGPAGQPLPMARLADMGLGEILLERNLLKEAGDYLQRGVPVAQSLWYLGSLHGMISMARLRQAQGDVSGAQAVIEEIERKALSTDSNGWDDAVAPAVAVRLALQRDDLGAAEQWWKKGGFPDLNTPIALENYPYHVFEYLLLTQASFLLFKGRKAGRIRDLKQAAELLATLLPGAERFQRLGSQIQILVLQALVQSGLGNERAAKTLLRALALGEPQGYRRLYLDEGGQLADLLGQCRSVQLQSGSQLPSLAYLDSLLEAIKRAAPAPHIAERPVEPRPGHTTAHLEDGLPISLSAREIEVLVLIAQGKSNQEISAELYLALNTVKRHAYNIYAKLQVKKRTQAVSRARQLGLIP